MKAVVARVTCAAVRVDGATVGEIGPGLLVLLGVHRDDGDEAVATMARKLHELRILDGERSCADTGAPLLVVSQFTLYGDTRKGRRPSWSAAAPPERAPAAGRRGGRRAAGARRDGGDRGVRRSDGRRVGERRPVHGAARGVRRETAPARRMPDEGREVPRGGQALVALRAARAVEAAFCGGLGGLSGRLLGAVHGLGGDGLGRLGDLLLHGLPGLDGGGDPLRREAPLGGQHLLGEVEVAVHDAQRVGQLSVAGGQVAGEALDGVGPVPDGGRDRLLAALGDVDELVGGRGHRPRPFCIDGVSLTKLCTGVNYVNHMRCDAGPTAVCAARRLAPG